MKESSIREILAELGIDAAHLSPTGWLICSCPFAQATHQYGTDRRPSFGVKVDLGSPSAYKCFTCHEHGLFTGLPIRLGTLLGDPGMYKQVRNRAVFLESVTLPDFDEGVAAQTVESLRVLDVAMLDIYPSPMDSEASRKYLLERGVSEHAALVMDLRFDSKENRILFPLFSRDRELLGFSGRSILSPLPDDVPKIKTYAGVKTDRCLLGIHLIPHQPDGKPIFVVEGLFAYAHLISIGARRFCHPVATLGCHLSFPQRDMLAMLGRPVFLCYDGDVAGTIGLFGKWNRQAKKFMGDGAVDRLKDHVPTFVCKYPVGRSDPDDLRLSDVTQMLDKWNTGY